MKPLAYLRAAWWDLLSAIQFLTRIPVPQPPWDANALARAVKYFSVVGLLVGGAAALLHRLIAPHVPRSVAALLVLIFLVLITGCFHEDGLADTADGFGGGNTRDQILTILRDSRIGSYGGTALVLSLLARLVLLASLPLEQVSSYLIVAHVLCRWTTLPLSYFLVPARTSDAPEATGLGARIARLTSTATLIVGTIFSFAVAAFLLHTAAIVPITSAVVLTLVTGLYYQRRINGISGDCLGATNQLTEIGVYLCGAWTR